jgi:hypothetical protein
MTAELCDCYATRRQGVLAVLAAVEAAAARLRKPAEVLVWRNDGCLAAIAEARADPLPAAAANWLALAAFAVPILPSRGPALVADMGSTTVDIVPIADGEPAPAARDDTGRLLAGELVYTGLRRTPVFALVDALPLRGARCPVIPELFATAQDARVLLGDLAPEPRNLDTADGRPLTREHAVSRLARSVGLDAESFTVEEAIEAACAIARAQEERIATGLRRVEERLGAPAAAAVVAGEGEAVLGRVISGLWPTCAIVPLSARVGEAASCAACAHALVALLGSTVHG